MGQLIRALSDREEYRVELTRSVERFILWYPRLIGGAWVFGIAVPTVVTVILSLAGCEKVIVLTVWLVWLVAVILFLVVVEHMRDSLKRQVSLDALSDDEIKTLFAARSSFDDVSSDWSGRSTKARDVE